MNCYSLCNRCSRVSANRPQPRVDGEIVQFVCVSFSTYIFKHPDWINYDVADLNENIEISAYYDVATCPGADTCDSSPYRVDVVHNVVLPCFISSSEED